MECLVPIACYITAVGLVFCGLYMPEHRRDALLPPIMGLLGWSIWQCRHLNGIPGLGFQFAMTAVITALNSPLVLHAEKEPLAIRIRPDGSRDWNIVAAYKRMINPRMLAATTATGDSMDGPRSDGSALRRRLLFVLRDVSKVAAIVFLRSKFQGLIVAVLSHSSPWDFSPAREPLVRRLLRISGHPSLHLRELAVRSFLSLFWIVDTATEVALSHAALRALLVGALALDAPHEWPPVFGSALGDAYTLRRFWGRFWHRLLSPAAGRWGAALAAKGGLSSSSSSSSPPLARNTFVAFFVFSVSGLAHAVIDHMLGRGSPAKQILFYWSNFAAVAFEVAVSKVWSRHRVGWRRRLGMGPTGSKVETVIMRLLGFVWVAAFFTWTTPRVIYPRLFQGMMRNMFLTPVP
ncbi:hypothetical protein Hte_009136 [Hypoxylon texense]